MSTLLLVGLSVLAGLIGFLCYVAWQNRLGQFKHWRQPPTNEPQENPVHFTPEGFALAETGTQVRWQEVESVLVYRNAGGLSRGLLFLEVETPDLDDPYYLAVPIAEWPTVLKNLRAVFPAIPDEQRFVAQQLATDSSVALVFDREGRSLEHILNP